MFKIIDLIVFSLITFFSNPLSIAFIKAEFYVPLILLISLRYIRSLKIDFFTFIFFFFMLISIISHIFYFPHSVSRDINIFLVSFSMLLCITNLGIRFLESYVKIIYFLILLSIPFWIAFNYAILLFGSDTVINNLKGISFTYAGVERSGLMFDYFRYNFLLFFNYTSNNELYYRNFGYMWEPGQFAAYISYGLIFLDILRYKFNYKINNKYYYIFYFGLLSTFSTAGYLALFCHIVISNISKDFFNGNGLLTKKIPIIFLLAIVFLIFSINLDFIYGKFLRQFTSDITSYNYYNGRLNFAFTLGEILKNPFFGSGTYAQLTSELLINMIVKSHNGYIIFARSWGIILFLIMNILALKSLTYIFKNKIIVTMYFIFFIIINSGQDLFVKFLPYVFLFFYHFEHLDRNRKII